MTRKMYFEAEDKNGNADLWVTDGTTAGTIAIGGIANIGVSGAGESGLGPTGLAVIGQEMVFAGSDAYPGSNDNGLWVTDGTAGGTTEIGGVSKGVGNSSDITNADPEGLSPIDITGFGSKALFEGLDASGYDYLWVTDGTLGGTEEIGGAANVGVKGKSTGGFSAEHFTAFGDHVLFDAIDSDNFDGLWITDGTAAGTVEIGGVDNAGIGDRNGTGFVATNFIMLGDVSLFSADNKEGDNALWVTNGTAVGTFEIGGANNAGVTGADNTDLAAGLGGAVQFGNRIFFSGNDNNEDMGLWATDGTAPGTREIGGLSDAAVAHAGPNGLHAADLTVMGQQLLFNGVNSLDFNELWASDGTVIGTTEIGGVADQLLQNVAADGLNPTFITSLGDVSVFIGMDDSGNGANGKATLWVTDGTTTGTHELGGTPDNQGIANVYAQGLNLDSLTASDGIAYFMGEDSTGEYVLWQTDGTVGGTHVVSDANGDAPPEGLNATGLVPGPIPPTALPPSLLPDDLTSVWYSNSLVAQFNPTTGTLKILNSANNYAIVATIALTGAALTGALVKLAADGTGGTNVSLIKFPSLNLQPHDVLVSGVKGEPYSAYSEHYVGKVLMGVDYYFTGVTGEPYSAYEYDYTGANVLIGKKFFFTGITGKNYTGYETDYDGGSNLERIAYTGVTGQAYSSYELDYNVGVYTGAEFTVTNVAPSATYSSYQIDYSSTNTYTGDKFFYTGVTGHSYTGEEADYDANGKLAKVLLTGMTGVAYSSEEEDFSAGTFTGAKYFYNNVVGQSYGAEEIDVNSTGQLTKAIYSGLTGTPYTSVEQDYNNNTVDQTVYTFANVAGKKYYEYTVTENSNNVETEETLYKNDGSHTEVGASAFQVLNSLGNDTMTSNAFFVEFALSEGFGKDTITDFYDHVENNSGGGLNISDIISLPSSDFANFAAVLSHAKNSGSNVVISAANGDQLTLDSMNTTSLAANSSHFTFSS